MTLPSVAEIEALNPESAFSLAVNHWGSQLPPLADASPSGKFGTEDAEVRNFLGDLAGNDRILHHMERLCKTMLIVEREKMDAGAAP
jgi:hypothetical protein